jgi:hypothetical protein
MRKFLLSILVAFTALTASAQSGIVATFDTLYLSKPDTFYVNYSAPGTDVGFDDGEIHFPCVYDTAFGYSFWSYGFAYSNMTDSVTSGFGNQYSAKTAAGYNGSPNYAVAYGAYNTVPYRNNPAFKNWNGFYITNSTYAYNSMRDGDAFSKKFGGITGNDADWFKLVIRRYMSGQLANDSVEFYLADFRSPNNANDYIVKDWQWVDLSSIGYGDSLLFTLSSSDTGQFGMNTPAYFCLDNFTVTLVPDAITSVSGPIAKIYPNPASDNIFVELGDIEVDNIRMLDASGKVLGLYLPKVKTLAVPTGELAPGMYFLQFNSGSNQQSIRFIKK